jgi:hypothetical protein
VPARIMMANNKRKIIKQKRQQKKKDQFNNQPVTEHCALFEK